MSWARVRGHDTIIQAFSQAVQRGRLGHAYLFVGPEGVGKKLVAIELAKTLLCENSNPPSTFDACDRCTACVQIKAGTHPDFQIVGLPDDKHEFPIELMQDVIRNLSMKPARGARRVAIIDDADEFNEESANCFLKTLEEPPPASLLILIGTSAERQYATVVSRCQIIRFAPLPEAVVAEELVRSGVVPQLQEARHLAKLSGGSLGLAPTLADKSLWDFRQELLDSISQPRMDSVAIADRVFKFVQEAGKESAPQRQRARLILKFLIDFVRAAILVQNGRQPNLMSTQDAQAVQRLAERVGPDTLLQLLERCLEADYQVDRRLQLVLVIEALVDTIGQRLQTASSG